MMNKYDVERALRHIIAEIDYELYTALDNGPVDKFEQLSEKFIEIIKGEYE
jgi:hypothetical protein